MSTDRTEAGRARAIVADLAQAARRGPVGPATILAATAALRPLLEHLADYETFADEQAAEDMELQRARHEAIVTGQVRLFQPRRHPTSTGGTAA